MLINKLKRAVFIGCGAAGIYLFLLLLACYAYAALDMNIDPPRVEIVAEPGERHTGFITVFNQDEYEILHVRAYINDMSLLPEGNNCFFPVGITPWSVGDWLKIGPTEFNVLPGDSAKVRYVVDVPEGVQGGRYGIVFFEVMPPLAKLKHITGTIVGVRIGSIFLITVNGTESYKAELQDLSVGEADENGDFQITCNVKNNSNVIIRPNGPLEIFDASKQKKAELKINPSKSALFPGMSRQFSAAYNKSNLSPGYYVAQVILDYGGKTRLGGQITFELQ